MGRREQPDALSVFVGGAIYEARKAKKMSLEQVGRAVGVTGSAVCYYENGRSQLHLLRFIQICRVLDIDPADVITRILQDGSHLIGPYNHRRDSND